VDAFFAANLRAAREAAGLSQEALAAKMAAAGHPMRQQVIARVEAGQRPVRLGEAIALAEAVGSTPGALAQPQGTAADAAAIAENTRQARASYEAALTAARRFAVLRQSLEWRTGQAEAGTHAADMAAEIAAAREVLALPPPLEQEDPHGVHRG
jgi:transcriptional regulator with XRE-family HTH domain